MAFHYPTSWPVVAMALLLLHGQATVERSFSINKELFVDNQQAVFSCKKGYQGPHSACAIVL